jgi:6-phosphogluconolactonase (cycloisomerase 2 family)
MNKLINSFTWIAGISFMVASSANALPFNIIVKAGTSLPTTVHAGSTVAAYYTVTNNTLSARNSNYVKYLPPNVSQTTSDATYEDTCGKSFNLAPAGQAGDSCTLQLSVAGSVNASDPDKHHHLFVCLPDGTSCSGTSNSLNVSLANPLHAYITNYNNSTMTQCSLNVNGTFNSCASSTLNISNPSGITINPADNVIYITNENGTYSNQITYCKIDANSGKLSSCNITGSGLSSPTAIAINTNGNLVYIANETAGVVYCSIYSDGSLDNCTNTGSGFSNPAGIWLNPTNTFAYIPNFGNNTVSYCSINTNGSFNTCSQSSAIFTQPNGVAINHAGTYIYVSNKSIDAIYYCQLNTDGSIGTCNATGSGFSRPFFIVFNDDNTIAYVSNAGNNTISACSIKSDGSLNSCTLTGSGLDQPRGISLA